MTAGRRTAVRPPLEPGRDEARAAAERELADPVYAAAEPSLLDRAATWLLDRFRDLLEAAGGAGPGGTVGLVLLVALAVAVVVAVRLRTGPLARTAAGDGALFDAGPLGAGEHRRAADEHAVAGRWAEAVRERLRAVVRGLEERDLLVPRPGRTAAEAAEEAGRALPGCAAPLRAGARTFDDVWYGGRAATADDDARLRALDDQVRTARPAPVAR